MMNCKKVAAMYFKASWVTVLQAWPQVAKSIAPADTSRRADLSPYVSEQMRATLEPRRTRKHWSGCFYGSVIGKAAESQAVGEISYLNILARIA
jgi:hypothetical protein